MEDEVILREVEDGDLAIFFEQQRDPDGFWMAGFNATDPHDRDAYMEKWAQIRSAPHTIMRAILFNGRVAGDIVCNQVGPDELLVGYWLGKEYWGQGVATRALRLFLAETPARPLYAYVLKDNARSQRVLQKCGFVITGEETRFSSVRGAEVESYLLTLGADATSGQE